MIDPIICKDIRAELAQLYRDNSVPLSMLMRDLASSKAYMHVSSFMADPKSYIDIYPKVLLACWKDQVKLLCFIYPKYEPDDEVLAAWLVLIHRGYFPQLLDVKNRDNIEALMLVHAGIMMATGTEK